MHSTMARRFATVTALALFATGTALVVGAEAASAAPAAPAGTVSATGLCSRLQAGGTYLELALSGTVTGLAPTTNTIVQIGTTPGPVGNAEPTTDASGTLHLSGQTAFLLTPGAGFVAGATYEWSISQQPPATGTLQGQLTVKSGNCSQPSPSPSTTHPSATPSSSAAPTSTTSTGSPGFPVQATTGGTGTPWFEQPALWVLVGLILMFGAGVLGLDTIRTALRREH